MNKKTFFSIGTIVLICTCLFISVYIITYKQTSYIFPIIGMILSIGLLIIESPRLKPEENSVFHEEDIQYKGGKQRRKTTKKSTGIWGKIKKIVLLIVAIFGLISSVITIYRECYPYENKQLEQVKDEIEILNKKIEKLEEINNPVVEISKDTIQ